MTAAMSIFRTVAPNVEQVHRVSCAYAKAPLSLPAVMCHCPLKYRARKPDGTRETFDSLEEATRATAAPSWITIDTMAAEFGKAMAAGTARTNAGEVYRPAVRKQYAGALQPWVNRFGTRRPDQLGSAEVQRWVDVLVQLGAAPSTIRNYMIAMRAMLRWAHARGYSQVAALPSAQLPRGERQRGNGMRAAEVAEYVLILDHEPTIQLIYALAFYAGLRRGEIAGLRWGDWSKMEGTLRVERAYSYSSAQIGPPKTESSRRTVPVPAPLHDLLLAARKRLVDGFVADLDYESGMLENVMPRPIVGLFHPSRTQRRAAARWVAAGLEPVGLHAARHAYASLLIHAGMNIKQVSTYMGHANVSITLDRYAHLMPDDTAAAVSQINTYLGRTS